MARVRQVETVLRGRELGKAWTAEQVTRLIYEGVPERLIPPATSVTTLVLRKLAEDGVVKMDDSGGGPVTWIPRPRL